MSLWDVFKEPAEAGYGGKPLIDYFTCLERGATRLGAAGKITTGAAAQACLDSGADFVLIGRAAILHKDFPQRVREDAHFQSVALPVTRAWLRDQGLGSAFVDYMATGWKGFVAADA